MSHHEKEFQIYMAFFSEYVDSCEETIQKGSYVDLHDGRCIYTNKDITAIILPEELIRLPILSQHKLPTVFGIESDGTYIAPCQHPIFEEQYASMAETLTSYINIAGKMSIYTIRTPNGTWNYTRIIPGTRVLDLPPPFRRNINEDDDLFCQISRIKDKWDMLSIGGIAYNTGAFTRTCIHSLYIIKMNTGDWRLSDKPIGSYPIPMSIICRRIFISMHKDLRAILDHIRYYRSPPVFPMTNPYSDIRICTQ